MYNWVTLLYGRNDHKWSQINYTSKKKSGMLASAPFLIRQFMSVLGWQFPALKVVEGEWPQGLIFDFEVTCFSFLFFFFTDLRLLPQSHCRRHWTLGVAGLGEAGRPGSGGPRAVPPRFRPVSVQQRQRLLSDLPVLVTRVLTALSQVTCFVVWMRLEPGDAEPSGSWGLDGLSPSGWRQPCVAMTTNSALSLLSQKKCILETDEES